MEQFIYRNIRKNDYAAIKNLINSVWHFERFATNERIRKDILEIYWMNCLREQTFARVVEYQGEVVGILLGRSESEYKRFKMSINACAIIWRIIRLCFSEEARHTTKGYRNFSRAYQELIENRIQEFDGELVLFIVDQNYRAKGIGKKLIELFFQYMKQTQTKCIYLYTDTECNYGFYDKQGFEKVDERWIDVENLIGKQQMGVYLYRYYVT